jgi:hypothetical protein
MTLALLGACNMVMTKTPVFTLADAAGAPALKPGVWRQDGGDPSCQFDESQPYESWPACANGVVIKDGVMGAYRIQGDSKTWVSTPFILASGSPRVFQTYLDATIGMTSLPPVYFYVALDPTASDDHGRITAFTSWIVLCGPPPPPGAMMPDGKTTRNGTLEPLPGLTMDASGNDCDTASPDAVRGAARASRQWAKPTDITHDHWVRDGEH